MTREPEDQGQQRSRTHEVTIGAGGATLLGDLTVPAGAREVVLFAHGSGSSRHSRRNRMVAELLQRRGMATLLMDLLTPEEDAQDQISRQLRFDIPMLAERLVAAIDWLAAEDSTRELNIGLFGASTGAAAALIAATQRPVSVGAVVSRGGRPDLAGVALPSVACPTLLLVGGRDVDVIELNKQAMAQMQAPTQLIVVPRASHLFEEPGALEDVARLAGDWFTTRLRPGNSHGNNHNNHNDKHRKDEP